MQDTAVLLRQIPKMDVLFNDATVVEMLNTYPQGLVKKALREATDDLRAQIIDGSCQQPTMEWIVCHAEKILKNGQRLHQRVVINATGVPLHTNLGRALLAQGAAKAAYEAAMNYTTLEFDCSTGMRGDRYAHVEGIIKELLGAQSAIVVNNNAAAVLLMLSAIAKGKEVIVSRGELVEIGGSFRVPEVMEQSGCILKEVGATNKTHPYDYERAINENTAALLKVHTSNYRVIGFCEDVGVDRLKQIGEKANLPVLHDVGSGALLPLERFGLKHEVTAKESLELGADVVCISGDKLLCGPQAGIIAGKKQYIDLMKKHPLMRAFRVDKMTLAALEATLMIYRDENSAARELPLYKMLSQTKQQLNEKANRLKGLIGVLPNTWIDIVDTVAQVGGGSAPGETFPSKAVTISASSIGAQKLHKLLLCADTPVVTRVGEDRVIFDMMCVMENQLPLIADELREIIGECK